MPRIEKHFSPCTSVNQTHKHEQSKLNVREFKEPSEGKQRRKIYSFS